MLSERDRLIPEFPAILPDISSVRTQLVYLQRIVETRTLTVEQYRDLATMLWKLRGLLREVLDQINQNEERG
jgi:hypothetical protein